MTLRCLVLNAAGPRWPDKDVGQAWLDHVLGSAGAPDIAFVQEVPGETWLERWTTSGYDVVLGPDRGWAVRSCLVAKPEVGLRPLDEGALPELRYHGSYVAAGLVPGTAVGDLTLLSVHAQPARAVERYLAAYPGRDDLAPRSGGDDPRDGGQLFDADVVLKTIERRAPAVLACGDLNEARGWDDTHLGHTWGAELFGRPGPDGNLVGGRLQAAGLVWVALGEGSDEVVTRRAPGHPALQLDHVVSGPGVAALVTQARVASNEWEDVAFSDHSPIWFELAV